MGRVPPGTPPNWATALNDDLNGIEAKADAALEQIAELGDIGTGGDYVPTSDKGAPNGVATLDGTSKVPDSLLPGALTRDSEVPGLAGAAISTSNAALTGPLDLRTTSTVNTAVSAHEAAGDPHPQYQRESTLNADVAAQVPTGALQAALDALPPNTLTQQQLEGKADRAELAPLANGIQANADTVTALQKIYVATLADPPGAGQPAGTLIARPAS